MRPVSVLFERGRLIRERNEKPVRVLMFDAMYPPPVRGGKEKQAHLLSRALLSDGLDVRVVTFAHSPTPGGAFEGVPVTRIPANALRYMLLPLLLVLFRFRYSILHIHTPSGVGRAAVLLGSVLRYRTVFKMPNESMFSDTSERREFEWKMVFRSIDAVVALNARQVVELSRFALPPRKIYRIHNGIEISGGLSSSRKVPGTLLKIVFVGRLVPQKRCHDLIDACSILGTNGVVWHLDIVGDGPELETLTRRAERLGVASRIVFHGAQSDALHYMNNADVLVVPSMKEGMANVILEAMSVGLPVIATDVGAARIQLGDWAARFVVPVGHPEDIAERLSYLIGSPEVYSEYSTGLFQRCMAHFAIESVAGEYRKMYRSLVEKRRLGVTPHESAG